MPREEAQRATQEWRDFVSGPRGSLADMRAHADRFMERFPVLPEVKVEPAKLNGVPGEWLTMPETEFGRIILYIHGGAFVFCSVRGYRALATRIAKAARAKVLTIEYGLAPENPFPAAIHDAVAAYKGLLQLGLAPSSIIIAGDSAGGALTMSTLLSLRDSRIPLPAAGVCISPWVDLECVGETMITKADVDPLCTKESMLKEAGLYLNGHDPRDPLASAIHADLRGLPPLLIQVGSEETLLDDSTRLARRAEDAGIPVTLEIYQDMPHVWHAFASYLPEGQRAIDKLGEFADRRFRSTARTQTAAPNDTKGISA